MSDCKICKKDETGETSIQCDLCDEWTHVSYTGLTNDHAEKVINYLCDCSDDDHLTTWRRTQATPEQVSDQSNPQQRQTI